MPHARQRHVPNAHLPEVATKKTTKSTRAGRDKDGAAGRLRICRTEFHGRSHFVRFDDWHLCRCPTSDANSLTLVTPPRPSANVPSRYLQPAMLLNCQRQDAREPSASITHAWLAGVRRNWAALGSRIISAFLSPPCSLSSSSSYAEHLPRHQASRVLLEC